jgi:predicted ATP-grasp superfamily ATP-dependent carboligase
MGNASEPPPFAGRAIVTYSRGLHALSVIRSLGRRGVEVIAADEVPVTPGSLSRYAVDRFTYPNPLSDPEGFVHAVEEAVERFDPGHPDVPYVLMPAHEETAVLAAAQARLAPRIRVPLADGAQFERVQHKGKFHAMAEERGWPVPRTWRFDAEALHRRAAELPYPVFIKHPKAVSGIGVHRVDGPAELERRFAELVEEHGLEPGDLPLVQEAVEGEDYCVTALYNRGAARAILSYRNVLTFPRGHGPGALRETVRAPVLEGIARRVLDDLGWHGIAQVDFRWTGREGDPPVVLEVNARFFGGVMQAMESGVDYPWLLFRMAVDGDVDPPEHIRYDVRTEKPVLGLLATIEEIAQDDDRWHELEGAWEGAKALLRSGQAWDAARDLLGALRASVDVSDRVSLARQLLLDKEAAVSMLFDTDDPLPVLGFVYPLAIFVRHGRLTPGLLSGVQG